MKTSLNKLSQYKFAVICVLVAVAFALAMEPQKAAALIKKHQETLADNKIVGGLLNVVNVGSVTGKDWRAAVEPQNKPVKSAGKGGSAPTPNNPGAVLYDQTNNASNNGVPDQDFEASFNAYDSEGADDFVVPAGRIWTVQSVVQTSTTGTPANQTADVVFYANAGGNVPGAAVCTKNGEVAVVTVGSTTTNLSGGGCALPAGTYWVGINVNQNFASFGQHFWSNRTTQSNAESVWRNPGDGFASGCTNFSRQTTCGVGGGQSPDLLFRLDGLDNPAIVEPPVGPGLAFPAAAEEGDQKMGSVLIYNVYTSGATNGTTQNTRINITNANPARDAYVHLFFVSEGCSVADSYLCLTKNQTASFLTSDLDPGTTGYLVAVAVNGITGCPEFFNFLIGDEYVKFATGHAANLGAEAIAALPDGASTCNGSSVTAQLNFDGVSYNQISHVLADDSVGSRADGNDKLLILNRIGGNLGTGAGSLSSVFGVFYDDAENALSFTFNGGHQFRSSLSNNFPRITPRFETFIPAGRTGWFKLWPATPGVLWGMTGAAINFNANAASSSGAFNGGHNLHKLRLTNQANYTIPVFPPSC